MAPQRRSKTLAAIGFASKRNPVVPGTALLRSTCLQAVITGKNIPKAAPIRNQPPQCTQDETETGSVPFVGAVKNLNPACSPFSPHLPKHSILPPPLFGQTLFQNLLISLSLRGGTRSQANATTGNVTRWPKRKRLHLADGRFQGYSKSRSRDCHFFHSFSGASLCGFSQR